MGTLFKFRFVNRIIIFSTLTAVTLSFQPPCYSQINAKTIDIQFIYRMEQLIEKIYKAVDKEDSNKAINLMFEAKAEVERTTGQTIDLDKQISFIEKEIKRKGTKIPKKQFAFKERKKI